MNFNVENITRENIKKLVPYSSARDEFKGYAKVYLDANENSLGSPLTKWYNRYPDPHQEKLKHEIATIKKISPVNILLGNGSDECIDLLYRCFCEPYKDNIIIMPPTYGMYEVSANINAVEIRVAPLNENFQPDLIHLENLIDKHTRIIWICSPNNPTGNNISRESVEMLLNNFDGLVVIDEAYINFSRQRSWIGDLAEYPNLVVLQTFSKAWGLAGLRIGMLFASKEITDTLNKVKAPYNISEPSQQLVLNAIKNISQVNEMILELVSMRNALAEVLEKLPIVNKVYPSDANFLLVKMHGAKEIYEFLKSKGIVVRDRSNVTLCEGCLRITIGTENENTMLVDALIEYSKSNR